MVKAIIFDCFGVLVGRGFWNVYESLGGDLQKDGTYINEMLAKANLKEISSDAFSQAMADKLNMPLAEYRRALENDEVPNEDLFALIRGTLKPAYKLAMVSNATGDSVRRKIPPEKMQLFDAVFISAEVGLLKPDPKLFDLALHKLSTSANETVFVDDHQQYIDGAKAFGLKTILFKNVDDFQRQLAQLAASNDQ